MPSAKLVDAVCKAVAGASRDGKAFELIDEVVDAYEVETQFFLEKEAENVSKLVGAVRELAGEGETIIKPLIDKIEQVVGNWKKVAYPIQLRKKAQGLEHMAGHDMANEIRSLAVELFNEHDLFFKAEWIIRLLLYYFSESPALVEKLEQDISAIQDIFHRNGQTVE